VSADCPSVCCLFIFISRDTVSQLSGGISVELFTQILIM